MSAAFEAGLEITALHNHFFFDEPKVISCIYQELAVQNVFLVVSRRFMTKWLKMQRATHAFVRFPKSIPQKSRISPEPSHNSGHERNLEDDV